VQRNITQIKSNQNISNVRRETTYILIGHQHKQQQCHKSSHANHNHKGMQSAQTNQKYHTQVKSHATLQIPENVKEKLNRKKM
jgi:hypothetical protein